jgi:hypothetical protein
MIRPEKPVIKTPPPPKPTITPPPPTQLEPKKKTKYPKVKKEMVEIIINDDYDRDSVLKEFKISHSSCNKLFSIIRTTIWVPKSDTTPLPQGYFLPSNIEQCIESVMYDRGFVVG